MKDYHSSHLVAYEEPESIGSSSIPVLHFLIGQPWGQVALNYVHALQPTSIRVTTGEIKLDCRDRRVTVYVTKDDIITGIEIEARVGLDGDFKHADHLEQTLFERGANPLYWDMS